LTARGSAAHQKAAFHVRDLGQVTNRAAAANAGNRTPERNRGAPTAADAMIATAQRIAFAMECFRLTGHSSFFCSQKKRSLGSSDPGRPPNERRGSLSPVPVGVEACIVYLARDFGQDQLPRCNRKAQSPRWSKLTTVRRLSGYTMQSVSPHRDNSLPLCRETERRQSAQPKIIL